MRATHAIFMSASGVMLQGPLRSSTDHIDPCKMLKRKRKAIPSYIYKRRISYTNFTSCHAIDISVSAAFSEAEYVRRRFCSSLAIPSLFDSSAASITVPENNRVVGGGAAVARVDHSRVTARPLATRRMMNNCAMPWFNNKKQ
jgi:hypothetical protein